MRRTPFILAVLLASVLALAAPGLRAAADLKPDKDLEIIARVTANILGREHYRRQSLDDALSEQLFDEYLRSLDPGRLYLSAEDVAAFASYRDRLDNHLLQGDIRFPYAVYRVLLRKVEAYRDFARETLLADTPLAFDADEEMVLERGKLPWQPEADLRETWRKRLKNDMLVLRLADRAAREKADNGEADAADATGEPSPWGQKPPPERIVDRASRYLQLLAESDASDVLEIYLTSLATVYDPHSAYMSPASVEDFNIQMSLSLAGIGAVLKSEDGYTQIVRIIDGGPAARDGRLQPEDRIIAVAQDKEEAIDIVDMPLKKVVQKIRGPAGSRVRLSILPAKEGVAAIPRAIELVRDEVKLTEQEAKGEVRELPLPGGLSARIGVIVLPSFYVDFAAAYRGDAEYKSSTRDLRRLLDGFRTQQVDGVVLDLRSNGGGGLLEAIQLTGLFIPKGPVVQVRHANGRIEVKEDEDPSVSYDGPLLVMANRLSASAAEIFAAAIQDYGRGVVVGDAHTHGKGTVQTILELDPILRHYGLRRKAGSAKVTTAMFYRVAGGSTQLRGVTPDIVFPSYTDLMEIGEQHLEHALPWNQIAAATYAADPSLAPFLDGLRARSEARRAANPKFQALAERLEVYRRFRERKTVSLNEEARWQDYLAEKRMLDEQLRMIRVDEDGEALDDGAKAKDDILLDESLAILVDLIHARLTPEDVAKAAPAAPAPQP